ncbi:hypothetical protein L1887_40727 [Cichorium endivia]|nr:hypothetical protein L1887_40727 [Cichorium endivia]
MATQSKSGRPDNDTILVAISNVNLSRNLTTYKEHLRVLIHILSRHKLARAFFDPPPEIPVSLLQDTVTTATKGQKCYSLTLLDGRKTTLDKKVFAATLQLPFHEFTFDRPTPHQLEYMIYKIDPNSYTQIQGRKISNARSQAKPYAPKTDTVFGKLRKLLESLLNLADPAEPALLSHLPETKDVPPYTQHPLRDCVAPKKLKKKASESSPSKQPPKKKQRKDKTVHISLSSPF